MKKLIFCSLCFFASLVAVGAGTVVCQAKPTIQPDQTQLMQQLLNEVRQLRTEVRLITTSLYRAQSAAERLKTQQDQVNRLDAELTRVRAMINEIRVGRPDLKEKVDVLQKRWDEGRIPESEWLAAKTALGELDRREPELVDRELKLTGELNSARAMLFELNRRMDQAEEDLRILTRINGETPQQKPA